MATITAFTAARSKEIEDTAIVAGLVDLAGNLILTNRRGDNFDAGHVVGPPAPNLADATTTVKGINRVATQAEVLAGTGDGFIRPPDLQTRSGTQTRSGLLRLATLAETLALTDPNTAVPPAHLADPALLGFRRVRPTGASRGGAGTVVLAADGTVRVTADGPTSISLDGAFGQGYNYMVQMQHFGSAATNQQLRFRKAGSDIAGATAYTFAGTYSSGAWGAAGAIGGYSNVTSSILLSVNGRSTANTVIHVFNGPTTSSHSIQFSTYTRDGAAYARWDAGAHTQTDADGLTLIAGAGSFVAGTEIKIWKLA